MSTRTISLKQLADRLNQMIAGNERRAQSDRNELPVYLEIWNGKKFSFAPIEFAAGTLTFSDQSGKNRIEAYMLRGDESRIIRPNRERSRNAKKHAILGSIKAGGVPDFWAGQLSATAFFGRGRAFLAREFAGWLKKETAWTNPAQIRSGVHLTGCSEAEMRSLFQEFRNWLSGESVNG